MRMIAKILLGLAGLAFWCAVTGSTFDFWWFVGLTPESFSLASTNLALLSIGLLLALKEPSEKV